MMVEVLVSVFQSEIKHFIMKFNFVLKTTFDKYCQNNFNCKPTYFQTKFYLGMSESKNICNDIILWICNYLYKYCSNKSTDLSENTCYTLYV